MTVNIKAVSILDSPSVEYIGFSDRIPVVQIPNFPELNIGLTLSEFRGLMESVKKCNPRDVIIEKGLIIFPNTLLRISLSPPSKYRQ